MSLNNCVLLIDIQMVLLSFFKISAQISVNLEKLILYPYFEQIDQKCSFKEYTIIQKCRDAEQKMSLPPP